MYKINSNEPYIKKEASFKLDEYKWMLDVDSQIVQAKHCNGN